MGKKIMRMERERKQEDREVVDGIRKSKTGEWRCK